MINGQLNCDLFQTIERDLIRITNYSQVIREKNLNIRSFVINLLYLKYTGGNSFIYFRILFVVDSVDFVVICNTVAQPFPIYNDIFNY